MLWRITLLLCSLWLGLAFECRADETEAKERFQLAHEAYQSSRFTRAAELFEEAHSLAPRAQVKYNAAIAWDHAGQPARSALAYEIALNMGGLVEEQAEAARTRLTTLRSQLGYLRINEPIGALVSVAYLEQQPVPIAAYLEPGTYRIKASFEDRKGEQVVRINAGESKALELDIAPRSPQPAPAPPPERDRAPSDDSQETLGWIGVGTGAALTGVAVFLASRFFASKQDFLDDQGNAGKRSNAERLRTQTYLALGGAGLLGGTGVVLLLTSPTFEF